MGCLPRRAAARDRPSRRRSGQRRRRGVGAPPRRGVRSVSVRHRGAKARRADLEEGGAHHRRGRLGDGLLMARELAIDLGTASTLVYRLGEGIVLDEPTVVALEATTGDVAAIGHEAWRIIGSGTGEV